MVRLIVSCRFELLSGVNVPFFINDFFARFHRSATASASKEVHLVVGFVCSNRLHFTSNVSEILAILRFLAALFFDFILFLQQ